MKRLLNLLVLLFVFTLCVKSQTIVTVNQYNVPYTIYGDSIKADTVSVIVDFQFNQKFDLATQVYGVSTDTVNASVAVTRSIDGDSNSYDTFWTYTALTDANPVESKDTSNYSKFVKFTINGSDTAVFNIVIKAFKPIQ